MGSQFSSLPAVSVVCPNPLGGNDSLIFITACHPVDSDRLRGSLGRGTVIEHAGYNFVKESAAGCLFAVEGCDD
jgi:hypothetical protein